MITEDYVSFETAKLLKEKGFDGECDLFGRTDESELIIREASKIAYKQGIDDECIILPTLQMAMKWLREVHKLSIEPYYDEVLTWVVDIKHIGKHTDTREFETVRENWYKTYEQACEAAIKYCLEILI